MLSGHFDGEHIVLDKPADLRPNTKVSIIVPEHDEPATEIVESCARLSGPILRKIWDNPLDAEYDKL